MAISGGIKFFDKSINLAADGTTIVGSTGDGSSASAIDRNKLSKWRSSGSDDTTTETLTLTLPTSTSFDRLLLLDHNFLDFNVQYSDTTLFTISVTQQGTGGLPEITDVTVPSGATMPPAASFDIFSAADATGYYVWFDKNNTSIDPAKAGKTGIEVDFIEGDSDSDIAAAAATAITAIGDFGATSLGAVITITNAANGVTTDATEEEFKNFDSVLGLDASIPAGIIETAFADDTAYYEFDSVTSDKLRIQILKTQVVDDEKNINQIIMTTEKGTLVGFPEIITPLRRNSSIRQLLDGRVSVSKSEETFNYSLNFSGYPAQTDFIPDVDLMNTLFDGEDTFIIWPCGGRRGSLFFNTTLRGFRLKDAIQSQIINDPFEPSYVRGIYVAPINLNVEMREHK